MIYLVRMFINLVSFSKALYLPHFENLFKVVWAQDMQSILHGTTIAIGYIKLL